MENLMALGLGTNIILGGIVGILIGASYALLQKVQATLMAGQGVGGVFRQHGLLIMVLVMLWITLLSYVHLKIQAVGDAAQTTTQPIE